MTPDIRATNSFDVFVGAGQPRFTGLPADYQKYFNLVTLNKNLFDVYTPAVVTDSTYSAVIPADGFVSSIEPVPGDATRARIGWTRQAEFKTMPKGTSVRIGGVLYTTVTASTVGYIYISINTRIKVGDGVSLEYYRTLAVLSKSASGDALAHLVNWQLASRRIQIAIDASQKSTAPSVMFSPNIPQGKALKFSKLGNRWISETIELSDWLIIK